MPVFPLLEVSDQMACKVIDREGAREESGEVIQGGPTKLNP